jgi:acetoin utilization protein AcuC
MAPPDDVFTMHAGPMACKRRAPRHIPAMPAPQLFGSEIYRGSTYGPKHPLSIQRVPATLDLIQALGWFDPARYATAPPADTAALTRFHTPAYVAALRQAEIDQRVSPEVRARHHLGAHGNAIYKEMFRRPATSVALTQAACRAVLDGGIAHNPAGGTHHGQPDRASGFCFVNDPVLGILAWLDAGLSRVLYVDIDAHHGDGVEQAFAGDPRVLAISVHEAGRWPHTGLAGDRANGSARNFPVPEHFNDSEMAHLLREAIIPLVEKFRPEAIMLQCGADALEEDPLARLSLSNNAHRGVVAALMGMAPRFVVLGGGGYNPYTVARCWAGLWATLNGHALPGTLPDAAQAVLRRQGYNRAAGRDPPEHWFTTLEDAPRPGPVRPEIPALARAALAD